MHPTDTIWPGTSAAWMPSSVRRLSLRICVAGFAMVLATAGLFARIMCFPVRHDEQMYLPVGALLSQGRLYSDFGFNNLPNLPLLLDLVFGLSHADHYLLTGRLVIFAAWLAAAAAMSILAWRATGSAPVTALMVLLLVTNPVLLGPPGMLVTNNFLPVPFALFALHLFIIGVDRDKPNWPAIAASGFCLALAAGFKANYIFLLPPFAIAALCLPRSATFGTRLRLVAGPLLIGGLVGGLPTISYFVGDPDGFVAHVLRYHRGPHLAYWSAHPSLDGEKIMSLPGKLQLAWSIWFEGAGALIAVAALSLGLAGRRHCDKAGWPAALTISLVGGAAIVSFIPTPAFPQYYILPLPFGLALTALLYGKLTPAGRGAMRPLLVAIALVTGVNGAPRLLGDLGNVGHSARWSGNQIKATGAELAALIPSATAGPIATLAPLFALEAGRRVYPELATGPLVYRVGDLIPQVDRRHYRMVSPTTVTRLLDAEPPAAIVTGFEGELDAPFVAYALKHGYRRSTTTGLSGRYGEGVLYVRPSTARAL